MTFPGSSRSALALWLLAVAWHGAAQGAFARLAQEYGFEALQHTQGVAWAVVTPPLILAALWVARRNRGSRGVLAVLAVLTLDVVGATTFVTRAEALHYPLYAAIAVLWGPRAFLPVALLGVIDELAQWAWLDTVRSAALPDGKDMVLNALGALTGVTLRWTSRTG